MAQLSPPPRKSSFGSNGSLHSDENVVIPLDRFQQQVDDWTITLPSSMPPNGHHDTGEYDGHRPSAILQELRDFNTQETHSNPPPRPDRVSSLHPDTVSINIPHDSPDIRRRSSRRLPENEKGSSNTKYSVEDDDERRMEIYWEDVRYSVWVGRGKEKKEKEILRGVGGRVLPGEMVAIMGGSGAGKSTLLNVLAGRVPTGTPTGIILANGRIRDRRKWKRLVGYVEQEDLLYENLTVRETLTTAALLRLPSSRYIKAQKLARVDKVLEQLGLTHVADSRIGNSQMGGISGGEKKRVSIGVELVTDPGTLFLDEPTTGLDSATARNICDMLKQLAKKTGKTIIMTIHMPRETILDMMDKVALMSKGKMVWFGPAEDALQHFEHLGHQCPPHTNPADFFLDLIQPDPRDPATTQTVEALYAEWSKVSNQYVKPIDDGLRQQVIKSQKMVQEDKKARKGLEKAWAEDGRDRWGVGWLGEFVVLLGRNFKQTWRDKIIIISALMQQFLLFLLLGFVFFRIKDDQAGVQNRYGVLFFICINQTFSFLMPIITVFPLERRIILRERAACSYHTTSAYLSKSISQWPLAALASLVFSLPVYWLIGLRPSFGHYIIFLVITQCLVLAAQSLGMLIGSSVPNVQMAQVFGPLVVVCFVIFGGNFANQESITPVLRWIQWISIIRYAYGAYMQNEFNGQTFECGGGGQGGGGMCVPQGSEIVRAFGLDIPSVAVCIIALLGLSLLFQVLAALVLRRTTRLRMKIV